MFYAHLVYILFIDFFLQDFRVLFQKKLTNSDVGCSQRIVIPKVRIMIFVKKVYFN